MLITPRVMFSFALPSRNHAQAERAGFSHLLFPRRDYDLLIFYIKGAPPPAMRLRKEQVGESEAEG